jgi:hypothetical protein
MSGDDEYDPEPDRVQEEARKRQHERSESVEEMAGQVGKLLGEHKYPVTAEELSVEYADQVIDLPNETESLGHVFDRLVDERFESEAEVREVVLNELTGEQGGPSECNDERPLSELDGDR